MSQAQATTDHNAIRSWIESRKGHPSIVRATHSDKPGHAGLLRVDFQQPDEGLEEVDWDEFFETFDANGLAFLYQDRTASGRKSRFHKFIRRESESDDKETDDKETSSDSKPRSTASKAGLDGSGKRQASPREEEEFEEIDEEDIEDEEEASSSARGDDDE